MSRAVLAGCLVCVLFVWGGRDRLADSRSRAADSAKLLNPSAWGGDHVGKPIPEYVTGDECLFCHRMDIGSAWPANRHNLTVRKVEPDSIALAALRQSALRREAGKVELLLGGKIQQRFLRVGEGFGKLEMLTTSWSGRERKLIDVDRPHWDIVKFGDACAGCHATAVAAKTRTFSALSLECYVCHGDVDVKHSKDTALVHLARKRLDSARVVTSICAQCHLRTGKSRSTGLPYPNNFVAGDNLFRDFQVDLSLECIRELNPADGHVLDNVRAVVLLGKEDVTCLSCHDVHKQSAKKHHRVARTDFCSYCHHSTGSMKIQKTYEVHSQTCAY